MLSLALPAEGAQDREDLLQTAAVQLFVARARAVDLRFSPDARGRALAESVNLVRALDPWPVAYTVRDGAPLKIWRAAALDSEEAPPPRAAPGTVLAAGPDGFVVAAGAGAVKVLGVQPASARRMPAADYLLGHPLAPGTLLGSTGDRHVPDRA